MLPTAISLVHGAWISSPIEPVSPTPLHLLSFTDNMRQALSLGVTRVTAPRHTMRKLTNPGFVQETSDKLRMRRKARLLMLKVLTMVSLSFFDEPEPAQTGKRVRKGEAPSISEVRSYLVFCPVTI